jgi:ribosomal-protein-alanine acetyltransferase
VIEWVAAGPADAGALAELAARTLSDAWSSAQFLEELGLPTARVMIAREGRLLLGYAAARLAAGDIELLGIAVHPDRRRSGIGRRLLARVQAEAPGARACHLEVREANDDARAFYRAQGFREVGKRSRYYPGGEHAVLMRASLGG